MTREVKAWWEASAESFQAEADIPVGVNWGWCALDEDPLGDVAGLRVLELGCGGGQCAVELAMRGADVVGVDLSTEQLGFATDLVEVHGADVALVQGDVTDLGIRDDAGFDLAFNTFVLQWVADLAGCFAEAHRVLRPGGRFVFSMPHPVYELADPESHRVEGSYFDTGRQVTADPDTEADLVTYRATVSDVYNALRDAGFVVERMLEPGSPDPDDYDAGPWGEHTPALMSKLPATLVVEARKQD